MVSSALAKIALILVSSSKSCRWARKLGLLEITWIWDEDIHFEHGLAMKNIETGVSLNRIGDHFFVNKEIVFK